MDLLLEDFEHYLSALIVSDLLISETPRKQPSPVGFDPARPRDLAKASYF